MYSYLLLPNFSFKLWTLLQLFPLTICFNVSFNAENTFLTSLIDLVLQFLLISVSWSSFQQDGHISSCLLPSFFQFWIYLFLLMLLYLFNPVMLRTIFKLFLFVLFLSLGIIHQWSVTCWRTIRRNNGWEAGRKKISCGGKSTGFFSCETTHAHSSWIVFQFRSCHCYYHVPHTLIHTIMKSHSYTFSIPFEILLEAFLSGSRSCITIPIFSPH